MVERVVWYNGKLVPESEAKISIYDEALMFGSMVFEMTRSFNKEHFKLREHIERLFRSAKYLRIKIPHSMDEMERIVEEVTAANDPMFAEDDEHRLMINVSRGPLSIYKNNVAGLEDRPTVIVSDFPLRWTVAGMGKLFDTGINAVLPSQRALPAGSLDARVKSRSRLHYLMANLEVSGYAGDNNWALLLDDRGFIAEGTGSNFFIVNKSVERGRRVTHLLTPYVGSALAGISRKYVLKLADSITFLEHTSEADLLPYDVYNADEAFMTGTPFCILPVTSINGEPIGDGKMGPMTRTLLGMWGIEVGVNIVGQIKDWDAANADKPVGVSPYAYTSTPFYGETGEASAR